MTEGRDCRMRVLIASHYFRPHVGGIEIVAQNQAMRLANHADDVTVVTSAIGSSTGVETTAEHYTIGRVAASNLLEKTFGVPFSIFSPKLLISMYRAAVSADVVHVH